MNEANRCWDFQHELLDRLRKRPFAELFALPAEQLVDGHSGLGRWKVYLLRSIGASGSIRIAAEARKRSLLIFTSVSSPSFEMLADGTIVEDERVDDD